MEQLEVAGVVRRTMDAAHLNAIANHPEVRPMLGGDGPADLAVLVEDPAHVTFQTEHGGFICVALGAGRYDCHSLFLPEGRGAGAFLAMREAIDYMFAATDCTELRTTVPCLNRAALVAARRSGFLTLFSSTLPWAAGARVEAEFLSLTLDRWALEAPTTARLGAWFHRQLTVAQLAAGVVRPPHADDPVHDHMVGAAVAMAQGGMVEKAVRVYNVWAQTTHYAPATVLRVRPAIIDVVDAVVSVTATGMEVLRCR